MDTPPQNRRRTTNYLPEPRFQLRFVRFLVVGSLIQMVVVCTILYYFVGENYRILVKYGGLEPDVAVVLHRELRILMGILISVFTLHLLGTLFLSILYSHRVGGAIYALKRTIYLINDGDENVELRLRKNDEFQEIADAFNLMVRNFRAAKSPRRRVGAAE